VLLGRSTYEAFEEGTIMSSRRIGKELPRLCTKESRHDLEDKTFGKEPAVVYWYILYIRLLYVQ
jgi:hypothetical protein